MVRLVIAVAVTLASGCKLRFDELADAARDAPPDAPPLALACNTPVQLSDATATNPRLTAIGAANRLVAAWIADDGSATAVGLRLLAPDLGQPVLDLPTGGAVGPVQTIAMAFNNGTIFTAVVASGASLTNVFAYDVTMSLRASNVIDNFTIVSSRGVAADRGQASELVLAGTRPSLQRTVVIGVDADGGSPTAPIDIGMADPRTQLTSLDNGVLVEQTNATNACNAVRIDAAVTTHGTATSWGTNGQCTQGIGGWAPSTTTLLMARGDTVDGDINHVIGTLGAGLTLTIPGESRLRTPATEGRITGFPTGFWTTYETSGMLEAAFVDLGGIVGVPKLLGPLANATGHEVVAHDGDAYAMWIDRGVYVARLCP